MPLDPDLAKELAKIHESAAAAHRDAAERDDKAQKRLDSLLDTLRTEREKDREEADQRFSAYQKTLDSIIERIAALEAGETAATKADADMEDLDTSASGADCTLQGRFSG